MADLSTLLSATPTPTTCGFLACSDTTLPAALDHRVIWIRPEDRCHVTRLEWADSTVHPDSSVTASKRPPEPNPGRPRVRADQPRP